MINRIALMRMSISETATIFVERILKMYSFNMAQLSKLICGKGDRTQPLFRIIRKPELFTSTLIKYLRRSPSNVNFRSFGNAGLSRLQVVFLK